MSWRMGVACGGVRITTRSETGSKSSDRLLANTADFLSPVNNAPARVVTLLHSLGMLSAIQKEEPQGSNSQNQLRLRVTSTTLRFFEMVPASAIHPAQLCIFYLC